MVIFKNFKWRHSDLQPTTYWFYLNGQISQSDPNQVKKEILFSNILSTKQSIMKVYNK